MLQSAEDLGFSVVDRPQYSPARVARFFWFNGTLSKSENDTEKKILHYWPPSVPLFDQAQSAGLVQGISGFTQQFCPDETCQSLTTKKHKLSFFSPEPDFYIVVMVEVPRAEGGEKDLWFERELEPQVLRTLVRHAYDAFLLLHGPLAERMAAETPDGLRRTLDRFMTSYLPVLQRLDVFTVLDGVSFMPMERNVWLQAHCLMNEAELSLPDVDKSALFFRDNLVCSSLDLPALRPVCRYLFHYPPNRAPLREVPPGGAVVALAHRSGPVHVGGAARHLLALKVGEVLVVFFLSRPPPAAPDAHLRFVKSGMTGALMGEMAAAFDRASRSESAFRYVYFNSQNWALKASLGGGRRISRDTLHVIAATHTAMTQQPAANEVMMRYGSSFVSAKRVDHRELFVIAENSNENLLEVENKANECASSILGNIYFG